MKLVSAALAALAVGAALAALAVGATLAAGCGGSGAAAPPPRNAEGYVVDVAGEGSNVPGFTLQVGTEEYEVLIDPAINYGFDLAHLREHERLSDPVRCVLEERDGRIYALSIADVRPSQSPP